MSDIDKILDAHDDMIEQSHQDWLKEQRNWDRTFDSPLNPPDILDRVENSIISNVHPTQSTLDAAERHIESTVIHPAHGPLDPLPYPREIIDRRNIGVGNLDPPGEGYNWTDRNRYWRDPPPYRGSGGGGRTGKSYSPPIKSAGKSIKPESSSTRKCPKTDEECSIDDCKKCPEYDTKNVSSIYNNCRKLKKQSDDLSGKK